MDVTDWIISNRDWLPIFVALLSLAVAVWVVYKASRSEIHSNTLYLFSRFNDVESVKTRHLLKASSNDAPINFQNKDEEFKEPFKRMVLLLCLISIMIQKKQVSSRIFLELFAHPLLMAMERLEPYLATRTDEHDKGMIVRRFEYLKSAAEASQRRHPL